MATNKDEIENVINGTAVDCTPEAKHGTIVPHSEKCTEKKDINEIF